jgi:hypothetical protein
MTPRRPTTEWLSVALVFLLLWVATPAPAAETAAMLTGAIVRSGDQSPLAGAKLHAADPETGTIYSSAPAGDDGGFILGDLPPATYAVAVESDGGLYLVQTPVALAPGTNRTVNVAVTPQPVNRNKTGDDDKDRGFGFKENPLTAALLTFGIATVIGVTIWGDSESPERASTPFTP